jgi:hypothetical protein
MWRNRPAAEFFLALPDMLEDKVTALCWDDVSFQILNPV